MEFLEKIKLNDNGLIPCIAQDASSMQVLMLAWMNKDAIIETLASGQMCYFSRSRNKLWRKGESSGQTQKLVRLTLDCDKDCLLALVDQQGEHKVACHTGRKQCFYFDITSDGKLLENQEIIISAEELYEN